VAKVRRRLAGAAISKETGGSSSAVQSSDAKAAETTPAEVYNPIREVMDANGKIYYISH
jgi:hypothetical protein